MDKRAVSVLLTIFMLISVWKCSQAGLKERAQEKADVANATLDFFKRYCNINYDYDDLIVCQCKMNHICNRSEANPAKCFDVVNVLMDRIIGYMFVHCTGEPPLAKIMAGGTNKLPHRPQETEFKGCACSLKRDSPPKSTTPTALPIPPHPDYPDYETH